MDKEKYTLTLTNETGSVTVDNLTMNGNNYVSENEVDLSGWRGIFKLTAKNGQGEVTEEIENAKLLQQVQYAWDGGKYYLTFCAVPKIELDQSTQDSKIEYIAMMADIDMEGVH